MKWWYWLILELLIAFGVIAWVYFCPSEIEGDFVRGMIGFILIYAIENCKDINKRRLNRMEKIKGYNIVKEKTNELLVSIEIGNDEVIEKDGYKVIPFYEEGNPTIEQNAGENQIEGELKMKRIKIYSVVFVEYTNCLQDTVSTNEEDLGNVEYLEIPKTGLLIREDELDEYKKYGQGFKSTTLVGEMYVKEEK
jgi:hypothetical protein